MRPPSVDRLARELAADDRFLLLGHASLVDAAREAIKLDPEHAIDAARAMAMQQLQSLLRSVVNGTGVLLHTNLGRAPLPPPTHLPSVLPSTPRRSRPTADTESPVRYSNVEFDLATGGRGSRRERIEPLMARLSGAQAALIVNNCAGALVLILAALAHGRGVTVSRGELVEIGGGFRIPDVLAQSGARLVEVGTTNRTRLADYAHAVSAQAVSAQAVSQRDISQRDASTSDVRASDVRASDVSPDHLPSDIAMVLTVHTSNYRLVGFTESASITELKTLGLPVVADIGSGLLDAATPWLADRSGKTPTLPWLAGEPAVRQTLADGADLVVFSCDKLLGGPQGGAIVGSRELVERCARHPLARALRPGSLVIDALQHTLLAYERRDLEALPFWRMATIEVAALQRRAEDIAASVNQPWCSAGPCTSAPGGGTLPEIEIPSYGLLLSGSRATSLRNWSTPIVARSHAGITIVDLRTVDPLDDPLLIEAISASTTAKGANAAVSTRVDWE